MSPKIIYSYSVKEYSYSYVSNRKKFSRSLFPSHPFHSLFNFFHDSLVVPGATDSTIAVGRGHPIPFDFREFLYKSTVSCAPRGAAPRIGDRSTGDIGTLCYRWGWENRTPARVLGKPPRNMLLVTRLRRSGKCEIAGLFTRIYICSVKKCSVSI